MIGLFVHARARASPHTGPRYEGVARGRPAEGDVRKKAERGAAFDWWCTSHQMHDVVRDSFSLGREVRYCYFDHLVCYHHGGSDRAHRR